MVETCVPIVASTVNTMVASLFSANPQVSYIPNHPDQEADTAVLNEIYQDFARRDGWALKNKINGRQGIITGNYCAYYEWKPANDGGYVHKTIVPVRDMIIDPQSTSADDWRYVGRRFFKTKKELEEDIIMTLKKAKRYTALAISKMYAQVASTTQIAINSEKTSNLALPHRAKQG